MDLDTFAARLADLAPQVTALAAEHPEWTVRRNGVGNAALMDGVFFVGWVDILAGTLTLVAPDAAERITP